MQKQVFVIPQDKKEQILLTWLGDANEEQLYEIVLEGDRSEADIYGVFLGRNNTSNVSNVRVVHKGRDTRAQVFAAGVVFDQSFLDFSGMLRVEHGAVGTKTFFRANLMILSPQARAHTFPGLEIEENSIAQGGHAATVGKLSEEQLFYLMSRGLGEEDAKRLVVKGFFEPVLKQIEESKQVTLREQLSSLLD